MLDLQRYTKRVVESGSTGEMVARMVPDERGEWTKYAVARAEIERLRDALGNFGSHRMNCAYIEGPTAPAICTCGYFAALGVDTSSVSLSDGVSK